MDEFKYEIQKEYGIISDGKWPKKLCLVSYNNAEPVYDIRPWNDDMTKMGKGVTLKLDELITLRDLIDKVLEE